MNETSRKFADLPQIRCEFRQGKGTLTASETLYRIRLSSTPDISATRLKEAITDYSQEYRNHRY
jgi:hypothetical protein